MQCCAAITAAACASARGTPSAPRWGPGPSWPPRAGAAAGRRGGSGDLALLSAASSCFALGAATVEHFKHLTAACAGRLAGLAVHVAVIAAWGVLSRRDPVLDAPAR